MSVYVCYRERESEQEGASGKAGVLIMLKAIWSHGNLNINLTKINGKFYETIFFSLPLVIV